MLLLRSLYVLNKRAHPPGPPHLVLEVELLLASVQAVEGVHLELLGELAAGDHGQGHCAQRPGVVVAAILLEEHQLGAQVVEMLCFLLWAQPAS